MSFALALLLAAPPWPEPDQLPDSANWPDPLVAFDGRAVTTADQWRRERKSELQQLFQHYMYGRRPEAPVYVQVNTQRVEPNALNGAATLKELSVITGPDAWPQLHVLLLVPNQRSGPVPAFVGLNFTGNHTTIADREVRLPTTWMRPQSTKSKKTKASDNDRGSAVDTWAFDQTIARGFAVATAYYGDVEPDTPGATAGLRSVLGGRETGAVMAWAWGLSRIADALARDPDIDGKRLAVVGHSRLGKAALVAAAFDERFGVAVINQAGCGGSAPSRGTAGETVKQINDKFPHWFHDRFKRFNESVNKLPFDQHSLVALCAPRPVLFTNAVEDQWANPAGQFQVLQAAEPVYKLLGTDGLVSPEVPKVGELSGGRLGYFIRPGKHAMTRGDWKIYLDYADRYLK